MDNHIKEMINGDFRVSHNTSRNWRMNEFHFHDVFEIYLSMTNNIKYFVGDKIYDVKKGDLFVFNNMDLHKSVVPPDLEYERFVLTFEPEYIKKYVDEDRHLFDCFLNRRDNFCHKISLTGDQTNSLISLFKRAEFYSRSSVYGASTYRKITLIEILLLVNSFYKSAIEEDGSHNNERYSRVQAIVYYIDEHLEEQLTLKILAANFYMSEYHLGCIFKEATGFSPIEYIINKRILKAREILRQGVSVTEVCERVGFNNYSHFIRTFKKLVGVSPKQYGKKGYSS